jgi:hypothetical protein
MTGEKIGHYIGKPLNINQEETLDLLAVRDKYPYASSLHMIYLKALAEQNDLKFEETLKQVAAHVMDREHLYALIKSQSEPKAPVERTEEKALESPENSISKDDANKEEVVNIIALTEDKDPNQDLKEEPEELTVSVIKEEATANTDVPFDTEALFSENTALDPEERFSDVEENTEAVVEESHFTSPISLEVDEKEIVIEQAEEPTLVADENISFVDWLKKKKRNERIQPLKPKKVTKEEVVNKTIKKPTRRKKSAEITALLNKFIAEEPSISRPVKDFYNPTKNAQRSIEEASDLVSETLAKIHVLQKNYRKAIHAYEQLILLYPEKKTFFASQIEKIKKESQQ